MGAGHLHSCDSVSVPGNTPDHLVNATVQHDKPMWQAFDVLPNWTTQDEAEKPHPRQNWLAPVQNFLPSTIGTIQISLAPGNPLLIGNMIDQPLLPPFQETKGMNTPQPCSATSVQEYSHVRHTTRFGQGKQQPYLYQRNGQFWVVQFMEETGHFRDLGGFRHIAKLMAYPGKLIESLELQGLQHSPVANQYRKPHLALEDEAHVITNGIAELEEHIAEERKAGNLARVWELQESCNDLKKYLRQGQLRRLDSNPREKARKAVSNAISRAKRLIKASMPEFADFIERSVGPNSASWMYSPPPPAPSWVLQPT